LAYNKTAGVGVAGPDSLYVGDGGAGSAGVHLLVGATRQVELAGTQTISGDKTIAIANLHVTGGVNGDVISTNGSGTLSFVAQPPASVVANAPLSGNGLTATPLGVTLATAIQVTTGTDHVNPITSLRLREQMGEDRLELDTTAKHVVPAINELYGLVTELHSFLEFVGTYNAATNVVTPNQPGHAIGTGPLPAAGPSNHGWVVIVTTAGTGTGNAPHVPIDVGDWLISSGSEWVLLDMNFHSVTASMVGVTAIPGLDASNVQAALAELLELGTVGVLVDGESITGTGKTGSPLVAVLDDGTY
jgi:hypothetical protein